MCFPKLPVETGKQREGCYPLPPCAYFYRSGSRPCSVSDWRTGSIHVLVADFPSFPFASLEPSGSYSILVSTPHHSRSLSRNESTPRPPALGFRNASPFRFSLALPPSRCFNIICTLQVEIISPSKRRDSIKWRIGHFRLTGPSDQSRGCAVPSSRPTRRGLVDDRNLVPPSRSAQAAALVIATAQPDQAYTGRAVAETSFTSIMTKTLEQFSSPRPRLGFYVIYHFLVHDRTLNDIPSGISMTHLLNSLSPTHLT